MTRSITTAAELDALPFPSAVAFPGYGDWYKIRDGRWLCDDGDILTSGELALVANGELAMTGDPSASVVPVVSDAAVSRGLAQSAAGETVDLGDFTQYLIPDAAVEAAARAIHAEGWTCEAHEPEGLDECEQCATSTPRLARAVLSAALPLLGAAPSATREDVDLAAVIAGVWDDGNAVGLDGWTGPECGGDEVDGYAVRAREHAVRRALDAITPRTDR